MLKRITALLLVTAMITAALICGCSNVGGGFGGNDTEQPNRADVLDDVPELNFNGATVIVLVREYDVFKSEVFSSGITGEPLNDIIYNREQLTEERLGVKLEMTSDPDGYAKVALSVASAMDDYQLVGDTPNDILTKEYIDAGVFSNLYNKERFPYIDFTKPWYPKMYVQNAVYNDAIYYLPSELSLTWLKYMGATFFNKTLAENVGYSDKMLYELVRDGKWTFDKQMEISASAYTDVTGNGKSEDDIFGIGLGSLSGIDPYMSSFEMTFATYDGKGVPTLGLDIPRHTAIVEKLYDLVFNTNHAYVIDDFENNWGYDKFNGKDDKVALKFAEEELLFATLELFTAGDPRIRNMESDFGIIPMPKWEEDQDGYYSYSATQHTIWSMPTTVRNTVMMSAVFEVLNSFSYQYVTPIYYNDLLNGQYTRDLESTEMMDIITSSYKVDFGIVYDYCLDRLSYDSVRYLIGEEKSTNANRWWRANGKRIQKELDKLLTIFEKQKEKGN